VTRISHRVPHHEILEAGERHMTMELDHTDLPWKWHSRIEDGLQTGSIYSEPRQGHAYSVAVAPKYQTPEQWKADAEFIIKAAENHSALILALQDIAARARFELEHPTELRDTAFSLIEKTALKALEKIK